MDTEKKVQIVSDFLINILLDIYEPKSKSYKKFIKEINEYAKEKTYNELKYEKSTFSFLVLPVFEGLLKYLDDPDKMYQIEINLIKVLHDLDDKGRILLTNSLVLHKYENLPESITEKELRRIYWYVANEKVIDSAAKTMKKIQAKENSLNQN